MRQALAVILATIWITGFEFLRNEMLLKHVWIEHFEGLGLDFATLPVNGALWTLWSLILAWVLYRLLTKLGFFEAVLLAWLPAFAMMWIALYNLQVLPLGLLCFAIPLSLVEVAVAAFIIKKTAGLPKTSII